MQRLLLIKPGEIELKLGNRREFVRRLKDQIHQRLGAIPYLLEEYPGRFFLTCEPRHEAVARFVLEHCPGVNGIARAFVVDKTPEAIAAAAVEAAREEVARGARSFKAETRRSDKSFPLDSYGMSATAGEAVCAAIPALSVDVHQPDFVLTLEIREREFLVIKGHSGA
ncbi:MAG: THUMP domain-containing protein, partial [Spirochaetales bacterium]|nr:THUMP domain-containing protein [Spirochaetales bacterium]